MRAKYVMVILCTFALIISSVSAYASWQTQEEKNIKTDSEIKTIKPLLVDGIFTAEVGMKENEPFMYFDGNYQVKDKIIYCDGTAKIEDKEGGFIEGKFNGYFKGVYFAIKITIEEKEKPFVIEGGYKLDENGQDFQGLCIKGKDKKVEWGWIKGTFEGITNKPSLIEGIFTAELGVRGNEKFLYLKGNYQVRDRIISCDGTIIRGDIKVGEFSGMFARGYFALRITVRERGERPFVIEGRYGIDENGENFRGVWSSDRGRRALRGWITGTFQGMEGDITLEGFPIFEKLLERPLFRNILLRVLIIV